MRYRALATDYDGTIAHHGRVDAPTLAALRRLRASGRRLLLVTGRELPDLHVAFPHLDLFDRVVAENGALLHRPDAGETRPLAPPPPPALLDRLRGEGVPLSVGRSVVATVVPHDRAVLAAVRDLGLDWQVSFNKGSVMALPAGVTKATGLAAALADLGLPAAAVVGVGDAENDGPFLRACGVAAAVANALPAVQAAADVVLVGPRGAGVAELVDRLLADDLAGVTPDPARHDPPAGPALK